MRGPEVYFCSTLVLTASEDTPSCRTRVRRCSRQLSFRLVLGSPVLTGHFPVRHGLLREQMVVGPDRPDRLGKRGRKTKQWTARCSPPLAGRTQLCSASSRVERHMTVSG